MDELLKNIQDVNLKIKALIDYSDGMDSYHKILLETQMIIILQNLELMKIDGNDLKCCGNCRINGIVNQESIIREENCRQGKDSSGSCFYCDEWEFDGLRIYERMELNK